METTFLVAALMLVLMAFAPVAPSNVPQAGLRTRIARQLHLWDRYLYHDPKIWHPRD